MHETNQLYAMKRVKKGIRCFFQEVEQDAAAEKAKKTELPTKKM